MPVFRRALKVSFCCTKDSVEWIGNGIYGRFLDGKFFWRSEGSQKELGSQNGNQAESGNWILATNVFGKNSKSSSGRRTPSFKFCFVIPPPHCAASTGQIAQRKPGPFCARLERIWANRVQNAPQLNHPLFVIYANSVSPVRNLYETLEPFEKLRKTCRGVWTSIFFYCAERRMSREIRDNIHENK